MPSPPAEHQLCREPVHIQRSPSLEVLQGDGHLRKSGGWLLLQVWRGADAVHFYSSATAQDLLEVRSERLRLMVELNLN